MPRFNVMCMTYRLVNLLLFITLALSISGIGQASQLAAETDVVPVFLPMITRHGSYIESTGILDPSFGVGGLVITDLNHTTDSGTAMALQHDGKLLVGGEIQGATTVDVGVARYNPDGGLDSAFGNGGWVSTDLFGNDEAAAIAIQPDGKILLGCTVAGDFALVRYYSNGELDSTFGTNGWVRTDILGSDDETKAVAIQADGSIVVGGYAMNISSNYDFALVRYLANGELDPSFGTTGKVTTDLTAQHDQIRGVVIQPDGKIIAIGPAKHIGYFHDFALARYNTNGSLDTSFGNGGFTFTDFNPDNPNHDFAYAVALQPDGRIVLAGATMIGEQYEFAVARYTNNGLLDTSFGTNGKVITSFGSGNDYGYAVALQPDGKIIVAGYANNGTNSDFTVVRYNPNGSLDPGFSEDGAVMTDLAGYDDIGLAVVLQANGRIVVAGNSFNGVNTDFALVRYK